MVNLKNIHPLSDFVRNIKARIATLKKTGEPAILTVNGQAEAVVLSAEAYQKLLEELEVQKTLNVAGNSLLEAMRAGQFSVKDVMASLKPNPHAALIPAEEAFARLERKFEARRKRKAS
jgi:PHD/YefM family antitoxin component YafN of YafNO toxin-antitoxin module